MKALMFIVMRRDNPDLTLAEVGQMKVKGLLLGEDQGAATAPTPGVPAPATRPSSVSSSTSPGTSTAA
jgi:hypothetical protein